MTRQILEQVRTGLAAGATVLLTASAVTLLDPRPATADGPTPLPADATLTKAGTSFLTAAAVNIDQPVRVAAATGEYLYWSFPAVAGQTSTVAATVTLADPADRSGPSTWSVDVFDGLRRRQPCTAGMQSPTGAATDREVRAGCVLRQVRGWAEPWSADPLPGTYFVRIAVTDLPESDLGLPVQVELRVSAEVSDDVTPEGGRLEAPLAPTARQGAVLTTVADDTTTDDTTAVAGAETGDGDDAQSWWSRLAGWFTDRLPGFSGRWVWTTIGGVLAAVGGVVGFGLTRRPRRPTAS